MLDKPQEMCDTTATEASERKTLLAGFEADMLQQSTLTTEEWKAEEHSNWNVFLSEETHSKHVYVQATSSCQFGRSPSGHCPQS
ncbi:hypothetical protein ccbrp13_23130 [Ktedonobacteria bacterium brp13]|nr:hypothetical protein ccbrp13_23130 [Ktedonobacteria bacterium brp13]